MAGRKAETWDEIKALIASRAANDYDRAVGLLGDLQDLAARDGKAAEVDARIRKLGAQHARKPSFIARPRRAGLLESAP